MQLIGTVVRLQVQRSRLKPGPRGARVYDPTPLLEVDELEITPRGVVGQTAAGPVVDVHHGDHPDSRFRVGRDGLSLLPRAHYAQLRQRYGPHLVDGSAAEGLLLDTPGPLTEADLAGELLLETVDGPPVRLTGAVAAAPCVEFSRFCLGAGADAPAPGDPGPAVRQALLDLDGGQRGFYAAAQGTGRVRAGARLTRA